MIKYMNEIEYTLEVNYMEISSDKVLNKMEELVRKAKAASTFEKKQSYITTIKTLCELFSEEEELSRNHQQFVQASIQIPVESKSIVSEAIPQKPMPLDDANGSSLLDF